MAKAPKQVMMLVEDELYELPEIKELVAKGHLVETFTYYSRQPGEYDLILSKSACMYMPGMEKYLGDMVRGARNRRYGAAQLSLEI